MTGLCRALAVPAFVIYAITLFVATHWPNLQIESDQIERPDIWIHVAAFATWSALLLFSGLVERASLWRTAALGWLCGALYAALDEALQALPFVHRTAAWDDYVADLSGVTLGCLVWLIAASLLKARRSPHVRS